MVFRNGGATEFGQSMLEAAKIVIGSTSGIPPPYTPLSGSIYPEVALACTSPSGEYCGRLLPVHLFPLSPPANSVYVTDSPPPCPGITAKLLNVGAMKSTDNSSFTAGIPPCDYVSILTL
ncbi:uncharacterized protein LOC143238332 isoform X2 [Tachypleus tridentatus]|uniref:uncharacterized protein LOC143238332 isoform X2 n=1 Tax=Tachypleus tridentatus TaxID=6853 RepID=UPI003FD5D420